MAVNYSFELLLNHYFKGKQFCELKYRGILGINVKRFFTTTNSCELPAKEVTKREICSFFVSHNPSSKYKIKSKKRYNSSFGCAIIRDSRRIGISFFKESKIIWYCSF